MSRNRKHTDGFRIKVVLEYLSGENGGLETISKKYGIAYSQLRRWVHLYEQHGAEVFSKSTGTYSGEFKVHVVKYMQKNGMSLVEAANYFGIPGDHTVPKWERIYYEEGPDALLEERRGRKNMGKKNISKPKKNVNENEDLLAEVQRLRMENEYLKKLNALVLEREKSEQKKK